MKILTVIGARPQFIKAAVVSRAITRYNESEATKQIDQIIVHTGQHFDDNMSAVFFEELHIPKPDHHLGIAGGGHGEMTGRMLAALEPLLIDENPDWVLVYGDTNSTLAGAMAAAKLNLPVAHVEAGLRSFNRNMPEEINRILADRLSRLLFTPTQTAVANLHREGINEKHIVNVGDVMYDAMLFYRPLADKQTDILKRLGLQAGSYALATVHRAENTDDPKRLRGVMDGLMQAAKKIDIVLPLHPRTRAALERNNLLESIGSVLRLIEPVGYLDMVKLESSASVIATDSGGVQKEAYFNRVPCVTLRDETEWVELVELGVNELAGADTDTIEHAIDRAMNIKVPEQLLYGDGHAGELIVEHLLQGMCY